MPRATLGTFTLGDTRAIFRQAPGVDQPVELLLLPRGKARDVKPERESLDAFFIRRLPRRWQPVRAGETFPLVHVRRRGDAGPAAFAQGRTLLNGPTTRAFRLRRQQRLRQPGTVTIRTTLTTADGLVAIHELVHYDGASALESRVTLRNDTPAMQTIELLTSFTLGGITPFATDDAPERLHLHRFRGGWSAEGRHEERLLEELNLERSWIGHGVRAERFGQVGSLPTNGFFPLAVVEDRAARVWWGAKLAHPGSWQLEVFRRGDQIGFAGGLADREHGHWWKQLAPTEAFTTPTAFLAVSGGGLDDVCDRLNEPSRRALKKQPALERKLPVVFNEWCSSWGNPTHGNLVALADRLRGTGVKYLVIDDGWAERPGPGIQQNGDWIVNRRAFPRGLRATADAIRRRGIVPGIWFEFEAVNQGARVWDETTHQLHRDGLPLQVGSRRFWDFRDPWVRRFLAERVIGLLRDNRLGYLKVDYNETLGLGCDGAESPGEGLRQQLAAVQDFFRQLRAELPELVIENCSSGGHRAEPSMMALTAMTSCSDAHETPDLPVIAANLHRLVCPAQNQVWCVLRASDSLQRLSYSLAAGFLGRLCLSGEIAQLPSAAWRFAREGLAHYQRATRFIAEGRFHRHGNFGPSYQHLTGWQSVVAMTPNAREAMIVWHTFARPPRAVTVPLPAGLSWSATHEFADRTAGARVAENTLELPLGRAWSGGVIFLRGKKARV